MDYSDIMDASGLSNYTDLPWLNSPYTESPPDDIMELSEIEELLAEFEAARAPEPTDIDAPKLFDSMDIDEVKSPQLQFLDSFEQPGQPSEELAICYFMFDRYINPSYFERPNLLENAQAWPGTSGGPHIETFIGSAYPVIPCFTPPISRPNDEVVKKPRRFKCSREQTLALERLYQQCPKPNQTTKRDLAHVINLSPTRVNIWFQNRRHRAKKHKEIQEAKMAQA